MYYYVRVNVLILNSVAINGEALPPYVPPPVPPKPPTKAEIDAEKLKNTPPADPKQVYLRSALFTTAGNALLD